MAYIHKDLGVPCMSIFEYWKHEAQTSGTNIDQAMEDYYNDLKEDEEKERQLILSDKEAALAMLQDYYNPEYADFEYQPVEIIEMLNAKVSFGMRQSTSQFTALVKCSDDKLRRLIYSRVDYSGSYMDPPDSDTSCQEIE